MTKSPRTTPGGASRHAAKTKPVELTASILARWPLPMPDEEGDKEERGRILVVGGAPEMPGGVILAATAALRAGAGKLQIATCRSIAGLVAAAVPEARVFALPETSGGAIAASAAGEIAERAGRVNAVLIGPGMIDERAVERLLLKLLPAIRETPTILDAAALSPLARHRDLLRHLDGKAIITPHAGELAGLLGREKSEIERESLAHAVATAVELNAVTALKGAGTYIADPGGSIYRSNAGNVGLATSGSGDTLSGIVAGLLARGADPAQATAWGVYLHGRAGDRLARRMGPLGFLARELLAEIPMLMWELGRKKPSR